MKAGSGDHSMVPCGIQCGIPIVSCCSHSCGFSSYIYMPSDPSDLSRIYIITLLKERVG